MRKLTRPMIIALEYIDSSETGNAMGPAPRSNTICALISRKLVDPHLDGNGPVRNTLTEAGWAELEARGLAVPANAVVDIDTAHAEALTENKRRDGDARFERLMEFLEGVNRTELRNMHPDDKWNAWRVTEETEAYEEHRARGWVVPSTVTRPESRMA